MLPIPVFNPGDTTTYPSGNGVINVGAADAGSKMLLYNESPFNINIDFLNGNQSILHAWEARYWTLDGDTRQVEWDINSALNVTSSPISLVIGELYRPGEKLEGTYPMGLIRQTNVGNAVSTTVSSSNQLLNTGNPGGTNIISVNDPTGTTMSADNDGQLTLLTKVGAALVQFLKSQSTDNPLLQLGAAAHLVECLGNLKIDGTSEHVGAATFDAAVNATGTIFANGGLNTNILRDDTNGNTALDLSAGTGAVALLHLLTLAAAGITVPALTDFLIPMPGTANKWSLTMGGTPQYSMDFTKLSALNGNGLSVAGTSTLTGDVTLGGKINGPAATNAILNAALGHQGEIEVNGTAVLIVDGGGLNFSSAKLFDTAAHKLCDWTAGGVIVCGQSTAHNRFNYQGDAAHTDWFLNAISTFTGAASGTFNHGMTQFGASVGPQIVMPVTNVAGSQTVGFDTVTSTQCHITLGAALSFRAWCFL